MTDPHGCQPEADAARQRLLDLLADRATQGLTLVEAAELQRLQSDHPELIDESLERVAAALDLALGPQRFEPLPSAVAARLHDGGADWMEARGESAPTLRPRESRLSTPDSRTAPFTSQTPSHQPRSVESRRVSPWPTRLGWLAAAACLALALLAWWPQLAPATRLDPARLRAQLIEQGGDVVQINWQPTGDAYGPAASGHVIWNPTVQQGVMRFQGLPANDPSQFQYQLWIFDKTRDERYPVDGGVFDIVATGSEPVDIIIDPKLTVRDAAAFAITVEPPGGVTVSNREHIVVLAPMAEAKPPARGSSAAPTARGGPQLRECEGPAATDAASRQRDSVRAGGI